MHSNEFRTEYNKPLFDATYNERKKDRRDTNSDMKHLLCNSSRPCIGMNNFQMSNNDPNKLYPGSEWRHQLYPGSNSNSIHIKKIPYSSRQYKMNPTKKTINIEMSKTFFNDKPPKKENIKGLRGSSAFKSNNAPKHYYTLRPRIDLLCNASRPCKYMPMMKSLNNESPFLKLLPKYPVTHKSNDAYVDDPIVQTQQRYKDTNGKNVNDSYLLEVIKLFFKFLYENSSSILNVFAMIEIKSNLIY